MTDTDENIPPPPDTLPPAKEPDPTPRELMNALLATRDTVVKEIAQAFTFLNERIDRLEEDALASDSYVRDKLDALSERAKKNETLEASRHKVLVDKLDALEGRVNQHDSRISAVERNAFPTTALWALVGVGATGVALVAWDLMRRRKSR